jgi:GT2 family glycosyltransferase
MPKENLGYMGRLYYAQNVSAVTGACMMMRKSVFEEVNGFDESFKVAFNDVDLCMRIRKAGYLIVFTPYAELYHYESKSRGLEDTPEKQKRFQGEVLRFKERWKKELEAGDPYYNPNLTLDREDFSVKIGKQEEK